MNKIASTLLMMSFIICIIALQTFAVAANQLPQTMTLEATLRDFKSNHPDFERDDIGLKNGMVKDTLGTNGKPVFSGISNASITSSETFSQWYKNVPKVNKKFNLTLTLNKTSSNIYTFNKIDFFPLDGKGFGNQNLDHDGKSRNFHFTMEIHNKFTYRGGEVFKFVGDDDVWVFINNKLVVDIGGIHVSKTGEVSLDSLGLIKGNDYSFDMFYAERRTNRSDFQIQTSIAFKTSSANDSTNIYTKLYKNDVLVSDGSKFAFTDDLKAEYFISGDLNENIQYSDNSEATYSSTSNLSVKFQLKTPYGIDINKFKLSDKISNLVNIKYKNCGDNSIINTVYLDKESVKGQVIISGNIEIPNDKLNLIEGIYDFKIFTVTLKNSIWGKRLTSDDRIFLKSFRLTSENKGIVISTDLELVTIKFWPSQFAKALIQDTGNWSTIIPKNTTLIVRNRIIDVN